ncbi:glycosyltransferase family 2 protein [Weissella confusa]|uniref:Glycosyltransferase family 2 protein n=1 Tax=Weissella confusa TaxID=1583 RepID=A0AAE2S912_WEICO|nr:glycosyltransferase family 2 protein [Weissella confusa]MBJ7633575.1 glycosyltransferase family 2 protein [Weissella confusa]MBJ7646340.1 glycosyltransferase family 2 protein [Weissella confusa]TGE52241.1 hypothetical protein C6P22_07900 [Weissella confusa]
MVLDKKVSSPSPYFSIIVTTFNSAATVVAALNSIEKQTFRDFELIIIDDNSIDNTVEIVRQWLGEHSTIGSTILRNENNLGVSTSRNKGIQTAKGRFVNFLDADDQWLPNRLIDDYVYLINHNNAMWIFSDYEVYTNGIFNSVRRRKVGEYRYGDMLSSGNPMGLLTVTIQRILILQVLFEDNRHEDYRLWLNLGRQGITAINTGNVVARYNISESSVSSNKKLSALWTLQVLMDHSKNPIKLTRWMLGYILNTIKRSSN